MKVVKVHKRLVLSVTIFLVAMMAVAPLVIFAGVGVSGPVNVIVNSRQVKFPDQEPLIIDGRVFVPVRGTFEEMGFYVQWCKDSQIATLANADTYIFIAANHTSFLVNGEEVTPDVPQQLVNGHLMLPLRAIAEAAYVCVEWDRRNRTVRITTDEHVISDAAVDVSPYVSEDSSEDAPSYAPEYPNYPNYPPAIQSDATGIPHTGNIFINHATGIFDEIGGTMIGRVYPQYVRVLAQQDNWTQISTWLGPSWIYSNFTPPTAELDNLLDRFGSDIAIYFHNLETGFRYRRNADEVYFGASISKAPFGLYIYQQAEGGETDLDAILTYTAADFMSGSGIIHHRYSIGATFTRRELVRLNLSYSDNIATLILRRVHGIEGYRSFVESIGANPTRVQDRIMNSNLTANEAGLFAMEIHRYIESGGRYSGEFQAHLLDNRYPFMVSDYPMASKTGWTRGMAWHDMAIVYAPSPYIIVILSRRNGVAQDYRDFAEISMAFQRFNATWFT